MKNINKFEYRKIEQKDAEKLSKLNCEMNQNLENPSWFLTMSSDLEHAKKMINSENFFILACFDDENLAGIASLDFKKRKLGEDLKFPGNIDDSKMLTFSFSIVGMEYRGLGLMFEMLKKIKGHAIDMGFEHANCTVHKDNYPSWKNLKKLGFEYYASIDQNKEFPRDVYLLDLCKEKN